MKKQLFRSALALLVSVQMVVGCYPAAALEPDISAQQPPSSNFISVASAQQEAPQRSISFNDGWTFNLGDVPGAQNKSFDDSSWRKLSLPHDWSIELDFDRYSPAGGGAGFLNGGVGWYRKSFVLPASAADKNITIDFGGVYMDSTVYVNGTFIGNYPYGYSTFSYDITSALVADGVTENVIAVKINHQQASSRWYSGSGIYRNVDLTVTDKVHVGRYGTYVTTPDLEENYKTGFAPVSIETTVENDSDTEAYALVRSTIYDENDQKIGETVATPAQTIPGKGMFTYEQELTVENPSLWGIDTPTLYRVYTEVVIDGNVVDNYDTTFGFRFFKFDANEGFYLNGEYMKLKGVCMHHDQGSLGAVANYRAIERQMEMMKEMGVNSIRVTHNPAADELIEICNKLGLLVIDETFDCWESGKRQYDYGRFFNKAATHPDAKPGTTWAEFDTKNMVNRGKNDPSIFMWSIGNEIIGSSVATATKLNKWVKEVDDTRPTTQGFNNFIGGFNDNSTEAKVAGVSDVFGLNYGENSYDKAHQLHPDWILLGTENSSATRSRGVYTHPGREGVADNHPDTQQSSYDVDRVSWGRTIQNAWKADRDRKFVAGEYVWTGFDYIGEPTPYIDRWPSKSSYFGIVDTAGIPKDAYYIYQSLWLSAEEKPIVHMLPHWNWKAGETVVMNIYSNLPTVELILNGKSLGEKSYVQKTTNYDMPYQEASDGNLYLKWDVPFEAGTIKAIAKDAEGNVITEQTYATAGAPAAVKLSADRNIITADGEDLSYITVDINDKDGNLVPTAENLVNFKVSGNGTIVGVDNGNAIAVDEKYKDNKRKAFSGKCMVIVQSTPDAGPFTLTASSLGLSSDSTTVFTVAPEDEGKKVLLGYEIPTINVVTGGEITLPSSVTAVYNIGDKEEKAVTWDALPENATDKPGTIKLGGTVNETGDKIEIIINVRGVVGVKEYRSYTLLGTIPTLPSTAQVVYSDGSADAKPVVWERELTAADVAEVSTIELTGTVEGVADYTAKAIIRVKNDPTYKMISRNTNNVGLPTAIYSYQQGADYGKNINDGSYSTASRWTNWTSNASRRNDWIGLEFDAKYDINSMDIWFFINGDCLVPDTTIVEYWNDTEWVAVSNQSKKLSGDFVASSTAKNTITFDSVNTNKIRLNMTNSKLNFGLIEMEVYTSSTGGSAIPDTDAQLAELKTDGALVEGFAAGKYQYTQVLEYVDALPVVTASLPENSNASLFIVQAQENNPVATVEVYAEDGVTKNIYSIQFEKNPPKLDIVELSVPNMNVTEDDVAPISVKAILEDGKAINNNVAQIEYIVTNGTGRIGVTGQDLYIYDAGTASLQASVTYDGETVLSNILEFDIAKNESVKTITAYESVTVITDKGVAPVLPEKVKATFDIGLPKEVSVVWDEIDPAKYAKYGEFIVQGSVEGQALKPQAKVVVKGVLAAQTFSTATPLGVAPILPSKVRVYFSDNTSDEIAVVWDEYDREILRTEETFTVNGTVVSAVTPDGKPMTTSMSIRVSSDSVNGDSFLSYKNGFWWPAPFASFTNTQGSDSISHLNDGTISYSVSGGSVNRWTNWTGTARSGDYVGIVIGKEVEEKRFIDNLSVYFYTDFGVALPTDYEIQYYTSDEIDTPRNLVMLGAIPADHMLNDDANWAAVPNLVAPDALSPTDVTNFAFDAVETYAIRIKMKAASGKSLGVTEIKGYEKLVEKSDSFTVSEISLNGTPIADFASDKMTYDVKLTDGVVPTVTAKSDNNSSIVIVPAPDANGTAKVIVTAEDGVTTASYSIHFTTDEIPPVDEDQVVLSDIPNLEGSIGTAFTLPVNVSKLAKEYKAIEGVVTIPTGVLVKSVTPTLSISDVNFDFHQEGNTLRFAFIATEKTPITFNGGVLLNIDAELTSEFTEADSISVQFTQFAAKDSDKSTNFDVSKAISNISFAPPPVVVTATASELYASDGIDVIPEGKKAVSVVFTGITETADITLNGVQFFFNQQRSNTNKQLVYVALVDATVTTDTLNDAASYTITDTGKQSLTFGDVNDSGEANPINAQDALDTLAAWLRKGDAPTEKQMLAMNVSADGRIDTTDAIAIVDAYVSEKDFAVVVK